MFIIGLDLGQAQDYTAIVVVEKKEHVYEPKPAEYHIRHIERPPLRTPYPDIVERVKTIFTSPQLKGKTILVVDKTGVGSPVVDMFKRASLGPLEAITITGGNTVNKDNDGYHVPKRDLVTNLQVLFQEGRIKVARELELSSILVEELLNFRVKIDVKTAHDSYEAWREGAHDDLVLATALACWYGEKVPSPRIRIIPVGW